MFKRARKDGYEGLVLRPIDYEYQQKRSWDWQKVKNIIDLDLEVISVYEGNGKYKNQLGGVIVRYDWPKENIKPPTKFNKAGQKVGEGFSDYQRRFFWNNKNEIIGKIIQVIITEFTDDGNFRHSRMGEKGIRHDKG
jgi:DNA ligase-1